METKLLIESLNKLVHLDFDAISAYDQAIKHCEHQLVSQQLTLFRGDHERHVTELSALITRLGGTPSQKHSVMGFAIEGFAAITSHGTHSSLMAMKGNEQLTNKTYAAALKTDLPPEARSVVQRNYVDEQRHLAWIKDALDKKIWEQARAGVSDAQHP
jgi:uncharacterized protein (TIGR02284 family)